MLGDAVLYAASRATSTAIDHVARRATWTAMGAVFLVCALVLALLVTFWVAEPRVGAVNAAALIAAGCLIVGLICLVMPWAIERSEAMQQRNVSTGTAVAEVVEEEAKEAVDYFGALQVVATAFLFGLGAARRLKR